MRQLECNCCHDTGDSFYSILSVKWIYGLEIARLGVPGRIQQSAISIPHLREPRTGRARQEISPSLSTTFRPVPLLVNWFWTLFPNRISVISIWSCIAKRIFLSPQYASAYVHACVCSLMQYARQRGGPFPYRFECRISPKRAIFILHSHRHPEFFLFQPDLVDTKRNRLSKRILTIVWYACFRDIYY